MTNGFGNWLAGFIDGEGSFNIARSSTGAHALRFHILLRDDDSGILYTIQQELGFGKIYSHKAHTRDRPGAKKGRMFVVTALGECLRLCDILLQFPLRAKKKKDFIVWAEAAAYKRHHPTRGKPNKERQHVHKQMAKYKRKLESGRA